MNGHVLSVAARKRHGVGKDAVASIDLIAGEGVLGDAHCGVRIKHRSRARYNPSLPNLRQVHLIHGELFEELERKGFRVTPAQMGENVTTRGLDLLAMPQGTRLAIGDLAVVELTGLRNPCIQLERMMPGLMAACLDRSASGALIRKAGVMAVVLSGGTVRAGDAIAVTVPDGVLQPLKPV
jgi:MOSC domain-containing protein YiiM